MPFEGSFSWILKDILRRRAEGEAEEKEDLESEAEAEEEEDVEVGERLKRVLSLIVVVFVKFDGSPFSSLWWLFEMMFTNRINQLFA